LWQANHIASLLARHEVETRIEVIRTTGDKLQAASLVQAGGKGLFTKEIEDALLAGSIDLAVHSLKDLPTAQTPGLSIAAIPEREDPRDVLAGGTLDQLKANARVGTSSNRRAAQLRLLRPDLHTEPVRGNVDTRLRKLGEGHFDALMLAAAGLRRLELQDHIAQIFTPEEICPAPGQGALGLQTRTDDEARLICSRLNDLATDISVRCERMVLASLGGGCELPIGAYAFTRKDHLHLIAGVFAPQGGECVRTQLDGDAADPESLGKRAADQLIAQGAYELLGLSKHG
jgi:hydroxymethylbilane synthase